MNDVIMTTEPVHAAISPMKLAYLSEDFYQLASSNIKISIETSAFLFCRSIEHAFKAAILSLDTSKTGKTKLRSVYSHKLNDLYKDVSKNFTFSLSSDDEQKLNRISAEYFEKEYEYPIQSKNIVRILDNYFRNASNYRKSNVLNIDIDCIQSIALQTNLFVKQNNFFLHAKTPQNGSGTLNLY